jgi:phospholipid/cholesterol/gamma-HCH transport system ATP-binding protein
MVGSSNGQGRAASEVGPGGNAIEVRALHKAFGRQPVLRGVDLDCPTGLITTLVGPSGCGKTVLLKHLSLLLRPDTGTIVIGGENILRLRGPALDGVRERFGVLFQAGALFDSLTVFENVAFPLVEKTRMSARDIAERVAETLAAVGLEGMEHKFPSELSGGMQKRTALARALVRRPKILLLDEPTTGLDPSRTRAIHALVRTTQQRFGLSAVLVSHDVPGVFEISDRVAFMHEGTVRLCGTVDTVRGANDPAFERFLAGRAAGDETAAAMGE